MVIIDTAHGRRLGEDRVVTVAVAVEDRQAPTVRCGGRVAENDERVASQPTWVSIGDVPPPVPLQQRLVVGLEEIEGIDPRLGRGEPATMPASETDTRRTRCLAIVAAVDPVADGGAVLDRDRAGALQDPGEAPVGVDDAVGDDRARGAGVETTPARAAPVGDGFGGGELGAGDDAPEHEEAARTGDQKVGVLAVPPDARPIGDFPVDDGVVVGQDHCLLAAVLQAGGEHLQTSSQFAVVIGPRVPRDTRRRRRRGGRFRVGEVRAGADDDRPCRGQHAVGIGRALRVAVGERHAGMETSRAALEQVCPRSLEHVRRSYTEPIDTCAGSECAQFVDGGDRRPLTHAIRLRPAAIRQRKGG